MATISGSVGVGGVNQTQDVTLVQTLLQRHKIWIDPLPMPAVTGAFDAATGQAIQAFQLNAAALLNPDSVVSPNGFTLQRLDQAVITGPNHRIFSLTSIDRSGGDLTTADFADAAKTLQCQPAAIEAVAQTETMRAAWDSDARPTILFERHYFSRLSGRLFDRTHPDISNPTAGGYGLFSAQYPKLRRAAMLDESAALQSASWGSFQIMGANYVAAGFKTVDEFVDAMLTGTRAHLDAFVSFIASDKQKSKALQTLDWPTFARLYNGPDYKKNDYDTKMAGAYAALSTPPPKAANQT